MPYDLGVIKRQRRERTAMAQITATKSARKE